MRVCVCASAKQSVHLARLVFRGSGVGLGLFSAHACIYTHLALIYGARCDRAAGGTDAATGARAAATTANSSSSRRGRAVVVGVGADTRASARGSSHV